MAQLDFRLSLSPVVVYFFLRCFGYALLASILAVPQGHALSRAHTWATVLFDCIVLIGRVQSCEIPSHSIKTWLGSARENMHAPSLVEKRARSELAPRFPPHLVLKLLTFCWERTGKSWRSYKVFIFKCAWLYGILVLGWLNCQTNIPGVLAEGALLWSSQVYLSRIMLPSRPYFTWPRCRWSYHTRICWELPT